MSTQVTDEMVAEALDAKAAMSQLHCYLYATEKCRCGEEWTDAHWMRFILERALSRASLVTEEPDWEYGSEAIEDDGEGPRPLSEDRIYWPLGVTAHASEPDEDQARQIIAGWQNARLIRRRKAGPWTPVQQEGGDDA